MNSFQSRSELKSGNSTYEIFRLSALAKRGVSLESLPYSLRILLENLLRHEDGKSVTAEDIEFLAKWDAKAEPSREIAYMPARVLMQDFTGVPPWWIWPPCAMPCVSWAAIRKKSTRCVRWIW